MSEQTMRVTTLNLPPKYFELLDRLVNSKRYPNRAELIRLAIRDLLLKELPTLNVEEDSTFQRREPEYEIAITIKGKRQSAHFLLKDIQNSCDLASKYLDLDIKFRGGMIS